LTSNDFLQFLSNLPQFCKTEIKAMKKQLASSHKANKKFELKSINIVQQL